jgi:hypothetical protein
MTVTTSLVNMTNYALLAVEQAGVQDYATSLRRSW